MYLLRDKIDEMAELVKNGGTICFPTDTIWALGCDATNEEAVRKIREIKGLPDKEGMVILVDSIQMLRQVVPTLSPRIETLLSLHHRPFTLIYNETTGLAANVGAADQSVAIRFTHDPFCQQLIRACERPLIGTSAAMYGEELPANFGTISSEVLGKADYVVKYRQDDKNLHQPSPVAQIDQFQELDFIRE